MRGTLLCSHRVLPHRLRPPPPRDTPVACRTFPERQPPSLQPLQGSHLLIIIAGIMSAAFLAAHAEAGERWAPLQAAGCPGSRSPSIPVLLPSEGWVGTAGPRVGLGCEWGSPGSGWGRERESNGGVGVAAVTPPPHPPQASLLPHPRSIPSIYREWRYFGEAGGSPIGSQPGDDVISAQSGGRTAPFSRPLPRPPSPRVPASAGHGASQRVGGKWGPPQPPLPGGFPGCPLAGCSVNASQGQESSGTRRVQPCGSPSWRICGC